MSESKPSKLFQSDRIVGGSEELRADVERYKALLMRYEQVVGSNATEDIPAIVQELVNGLVPCPRADPVGMYIDSSWESVLAKLTLGVINAYRCYLELVQEQPDNTLLLYTEGFLAVDASIGMLARFLYDDEVWTP
jgi:hypothetical protein